VVAQSDLSSNRIIKEIEGIWKVLNGLEDEEDGAAASIRRRSRRQTQVAKLEPEGMEAQPEEEVLSGWI
jgi:hypothetical protein